MRGFSNTVVVAVIVVTLLFSIDARAENKNPFVVKINSHGETFKLAAAIWLTVTVTNLSSRSRVFFHEAGQPDNGANTFGIKVWHRDGRPVRPSEYGKMVLGIHETKQVSGRDDAERVNEALYSGKGDAVELQTGQSYSENSYIGSIYDMNEPDDYLIRAGASDVDGTTVYSDVIMVTVAGH